MIVACLQFASGFLVFREIARVSEFLERGADGRLRLLRLGPHGGVDTALRTDPCVAAKEIHAASAEAEQRRHPRVVVICFAEMAFGAVLCSAYAARGVCEMRVVSLPRVALGAHCLLLRIHPLAVPGLRTDNDGGRRTQHGEAMVFCGGIHAELKHIVAHDLWIVGGEIALQHTLEFILWHALVGLHWQVAAEARSCPTCVANLAVKFLVRVREFLRAVLRLRHGAPCFAVTMHRFCVGGLGVVARMRGINDVLRLRNFPALVGRHG